VEIDTNWHFTLNLNPETHYNYQVKVFTFYSLQTGSLKMGRMKNGRTVFQSEQPVVLHLILVPEVILNFSSRITSPHFAHTVEKVVSSEDKKL
jgi:hypothetical protein